MYTILVNSSDGFDDCWNPFFNLFHKYWPNCKHQILLNTEFKEFSYNGLNLKSAQVNLDINRKLSWSECLIKALNKIETPLVLYFQEDYFIEKDVMISVIDEFANLMQCDTSIKYIGLTDNSKYQSFTKWSGDTRFWKISANSKYRITTQCGLWDKQTLLSYLKPEENAWMFEIFGTQRARKNKDLFLTVNRDIYNSNNPIVLYQVTGIIKGKWLSTIPDLFLRESIDIDFSKRGFYRNKSKIFRKLETFKKLIKDPIKLYHGYRGL